MSINDAIENEIQSKIKFTTFGNIPHCHFMFIKYIIEKITNEKKTIGEIKTTLITGIETFLRLNNSLSDSENELEEILSLKDIFNITKNNILMKYKEDIDLNKLIMSEHYYLTYFDIIILSYMFNIPTVILFSSGFNTFGSGINVMHNNTNEIKNGEIINDQQNNKTIIICYSHDKSGLPQFTLLEKNNTLLFGLNEMQKISKLRVTSNRYIIESNIHLYRKMLELK